MIRVYLILFLLAVLALASMISAVVYTRLKASALQSEIRTVRLSKIEAEAELARTETEISGLEKHLRENQQQRNLLAVLGEALSLHSDSSTFAVQLSAHHSFQDAENLARDIRQLISRRISVQRVKLATGFWFRVLITPFDTQAEARDYADSLVEQKIIKEYYIQRIPRASAPSDSVAATGS